MPKQVAQEQQRLVCPSCGGVELKEIRHNGEYYWQCVTPRQKKLGAGKRTREFVGPCGFWSTKEEAWLQNS